VMRAAAWYFLRARSPRGLPLDSVARFHLGNGARLERINWLGDTAERAITQAHGLMVNYLYDLDEIEKNHEAYAEGRTVVASNAVQRLLRPALELVPIAG
jgi:malonyl-CoA decarboxylase